MNVASTSKEKIQELFSLQKEFFESQATKSIRFRLDALQALKLSIKKYEDNVLEALWNDLHKSAQEAYYTELAIVYSEIDYQIKNLSKWAQPQYALPTLTTFPATGKMIFEPLGMALIVSPWNYPFHLSLNTLIGAISGGNCSIVKPSPDAAHTANIINKIISETFPPNFIACISGGRDVNEFLFDIPFDVVCFTGSSKVGSIFMEKFAKHLSKMILELGGKSPCIVNCDANINLAAKRIVWGKTINAGQTCIAPDYLWVHEDVKDELLKYMESYAKEFFGENPKESPYYGRMIHDDAQKRVSSYLSLGTPAFGGSTSDEERFIEFTPLLNVDPQSEVMQTEIFGPILPVYSFKDMDEPINIIKNKPKPLAFYYFGSSQSSKKVFTEVTSGGACINDTLMHIANHRMPFGGVGYSGQGNYHGRYSFEAFSHKRSISMTPTWIDVPVKYTPYPLYNFVKKFI